ncbi:MAG TPA: hypothetical protein VET23_15100 [Chitinophagaceae bacterium]|nr:hypothetical protein [Chitinophagaceae bacterium]
MTTTLFSDNRLIDRRYIGNFGNSWHTEPRVLEIPQQQDFFNIFPNQIQFSAWSEFKEQLQNNSFRMYNPEDWVISFAKMLNTLLEINASNIHSQITSVNSLVIKSETAKGNLYAEIFFDEITGWPIETVINIFHGQQLQLNNSGSLENMILAIKQYFGTEEIDYLTYLHRASAYDLSGTALTTFDF